MAVEAIELLQKKGFKAQRLEHGVTELRDRGFRIEKSEPTTQPAVEQGARR
jgi:hypothetical protein